MIAGILLQKSDVRDTKVLSQALVVQTWADMIVQ